MLGGIYHKTKADISNENCNINNEMKYKETT